MKLLKLFPVIIAALVSTSALQAAENPGYEFDPARSQGGTGKFYMGREISGVMGHQAAGWLEREQRTHEEMPDEVVANMGLEPDDVVADIGAGTGYFTFRMAPLVPEGKVLATDIQPEMLTLLRQRQAELGISNVEPLLGQIDDPGLPENAVDVVLLVDAYHEFSHPFEMMDGINNALKPGGRVILLEYRAEDDTVPIRPLHKMSEEQVVREMSVFGLHWDDTLDFLPWQHMLIFSKPE
ncbi:methyltransferase type 11 [Pseudohongiella acticola]|uniref:Methyltransferase type 11 n=1 Tax=Pseudohongiella acticola TaxID=1524254 RepID=A0A1E8CGJ9_9GAMM|nr:class I SAM-dependent methyltransferase [Pseudohongiella acticola]OFE11630.1 methyltransferase type 11 [Pseudohongiella acticola]